MNMEEAYQDFKEKYGHSAINPYKLWVAACTWSSSSKKRSSMQNALYWRRINEISEQAFLNKQQFSAFSWHIYCKQNIMPIEFEDKTGKIITKYIQLPDNSTSLISTSKMCKKSFADYITAVEAYGAGLGVDFSENPNECD
tara:strand:- start:4281 stop:4703 length:423 start_codon:yes stop_codon:yes gene_type:complete